MRVVVDTNLLISALLLRRSLPGHLVALWRERMFDLMIAAEQLDEVRRVTRYPRLRRRIPVAQAGRLINDLRSLGIMLDRLPSVVVCKDPDDNYLLAMAEAGSADFLVSGDKRDLLGIRVHKGTKIVTVRDFLSLQGRSA